MMIDDGVFRLLQLLSRGNESEKLSDYDPRRRMRSWVWLRCSFECCMHQKMLCYCFWIPVVGSMLSDDEWVLLVLSLLIFVSSTMRGLYGFIRKEMCQLFVISRILHSHEWWSIAGHGTHNQVKLSLEGLIPSRTKHSRGECSFEIQVQ